MAFAPPSIESVPATGTADEPFSELRDILARVVAAQAGGGAALAIYLDGRPVVDLHAGDYRADSLQPVFSISKAIAAIVAARLHDAGSLDLDAPLSDVWPEFDRPTKRSITTRMVLSHRSGLPAVDAELSLEELASGAEDVAIGAQEPYWAPGTQHGYHAFTFGTLLDGVFRRALGRSVGDLVADHLAVPLGLDLWIGMPAQVRDRLAPVLRPRIAVTERSMETAARSRIPVGQIGRLARTTDVYNAPLFTSAGFPAVGGVAGARDLARLFAATLDSVDGVRVLDAAGRERLVAERSSGTDAVLGIPIAFGSGVQLPFPQLPLLGPSSFGHEAAGGSVAFADPDAGLAVGYTTSMFPPMAGSGIGFDTLLAGIRHCLPR
ncbi:serine hydrolase domain-containing protein [Mycetocola sp. 2940]|uniref:serine hydrolase domain-containing protein n=1 Tax=Mycetocola sp. 2940 TaxID=3156452 RepID=UPI003398EF3B